MIRRSPRSFILWLNTSTRLFDLCRGVMRQAAGGRLLALGATAVLAACAGGSGTNLLGTPATTQASAPAGGIVAETPIARRESVKVAVLLPLSKPGRAGIVAKSLKQAGELALFEFDRPDVVLFTKDTKGTPEGARDAAMEAVKAGAQLVIGPLFKESVRSASVITRSANIPMVAFSSDAAVAGENVYLMSFLAGDDVPRIINFAAQRGKVRYAALVPKTPYGAIVEQRFRNSVAANGGEVVVVEQYPLDANGMLEPVKRLRAAEEQAAASGAPLDALLVPAGQQSMTTLSPLIPYFAIDTKRTQLLGTGDWDYPNVGAEKPLLGGWYPSPDPQGWREFSQRYVKTYGKPPPRIASIGYDAVSLAISLARNGTGADRFSAANLTRDSGFAGVDGLFRLRANGTVERGLSVLEVQRFGPRVLDPAPRGFGVSPRYTAAGNTLSNTASNSLGGSLN
ncbi:MAG: penicillin-binding protein activator [Pseudomonadota bacterium]